MLVYIAIGATFLLGFLLSWAFLFDQDHEVVVKYGKRELSTDGDSYLDIPVSDVLQTEKKENSLQSLQNKLSRFKRRNDIPTGDPA